MYRFKSLRSLLAAACICVMIVPSVASAAEGVVTSAFANLREEADSSSRKLTEIKQDSLVEILGESGSWYHVSYDNKTGYVMKKFVTAVSAARSGGTLVVGSTGSAVRELQQLLRDRGLYTGAVDGIYGSGTERAVRAFQRSAGLKVDGKAGTQTLNALKNQSTGSTLVSGSSGSSVRQLQQLLKEHGFYTGSVDGVYGSGTERAVRAFQSAASLTIDGKAGIQTMTALENYTGNDDALRPGSSGSDVRELQQLLKKHGYYTGSVDGIYGSGTERAVRAFQDDAGLTVDGKAGAKTLEALSSYKRTESLDWFKNGSSTIPKGAVITIKDVETGRTFQLKRWSGVNHADCEPLTAEDTATIKSIYGGSWSWRRRAILVSYNGHVYAASMNGMPHGDDTISSNNFDGHLCVHFTGSKTHGTKKVDPDHQNAIQQALKATW